MRVGKQVVVHPDKRTQLSNKKESGYCFTQQYGCILNAFFYMKKAGPKRLPIHLYDILEKADRLPGTRGCRGGFDCQGAGRGSWGCVELRWCTGNCRAHSLRATHRESYHRQSCEGPTRTTRENLRCNTNWDKVT